MKRNLLILSFLLFSVSLGCNIIQSFAVSCDGYGWYNNGIVPEQHGLKYDFTIRKR